jgi:sn-glycerol 3-phosphate transport system substrate-binding protein
MQPKDRNQRYVAIARRPTPVPLTHKHQGAVLFAVLGVVLALIATACGGSTPSASKSSGTSASSGKPIDVSFWYGLGGTLGKEVQTMVGQFNASHPEIHVTATFEGSYSGGGPEQQKLLAAIAAHQVPDIAQIEVDSMPVFEASGATMPLTKFIATSTDDRTSDFLPGMPISTQYKGVTYGIPFNRSVPLVFYNMQMFKAAGITSPPSSWNQLETDATRLTHGTGAAKVYGFSPLADWWPWESEVWSGGGHILSPNLKTAVFDQPAAESILRQLRSMQTNGTAIVQSGSEKYQLTTASFIDQKVAMDEDTAADIGYVEAQVKGAFPWSTAMMPADTTRLVPPGGADAVIMKGIPATTAKAAFKFIEWWTSTPRTIEWSEATGYLPVQKGALTNPGFEAFVKAHPAEQAPLAEIAYQHQPPESPHYLNVLQTVENGLAATFFNNTPVSTAMKTAASQVNSDLGQ